MSTDEVDRLFEVIADEPARVRRIENELNQVEDDSTPDLAGVRAAVEGLAAVQRAKLALASLPPAVLDAGVRRRHQLLDGDYQ
jgi:hypothetical protein